MLERAGIAIEEHQLSGNGMFARYRARAVMVLGVARSAPVIAAVAPQHAVELLRRQ